MKRKLLVLFTILTCYGKLFSQTIKYEYDTAGNRTATVIVLPENNQAGSAGKKAIYKNILNKNMVKIFPNPTKGNLGVSISNYKNEKLLCYAEIYNLNGKKLQKLKLELNSINQLDFSKYASGIYLLYIISDKERLSFKIVKN